MLVLRFTHVFFAALWVGMMAFQTFYMMPALTEVGPEGGKFMGALMRRRIPLVMMIVAILALVSGIWLFQRLAGGNPAALMRTPMGKGFAVGGAAALLAFVLGMTVTRPAMMRVMRLSESLAGTPGDQRAAKQAEIQRLRARATVMGPIVAGLLLFALAAMAVARYL